MFKVGFLGRARLGLDVLEGLLSNPNVQVPVIICCGATPEVEDTSARMERLAAEHGIDFFTTNQINRPEWQARLASYDLDLAVAMLWLHTINDDIIRTARLGFINCHGGHLPKYRGNACANWAILNGEPFIGTSAHLMAPGVLDNGPVILQDGVPIGPDTYIGELVAALEVKGRDLVLRSVEAFRTGSAVPIPQDETEASYCYPRIPRDGEIAWTENAQKIRRLVRAAGRPYPGAYSWFMDHRSGGTIRKMTIWRAHVERHPLNEYHAVPGHLLRLDGGAKWGVVCGDKELLILDEIDIDGEPVAASAFFKTVRQRLGLDHGLLAAQTSRRLDVLESLGATSARFAARHGSELEALEAETNAAIERALSLLLAAGVSAEAADLRNRSFRKGWFDWEARECWFGVQIYRSLARNDEIAPEFRIGHWHFGNAAGEIERRIYVALDHSDAPRLGRRAEAVFRAQFEELTHVSRTQEGHVRGLYARIEETAERAAARLADLAMAFGTSAG